MHVAAVSHLDVLVVRSVLRHGPIHLHFRPVRGRRPRVLFLQQLRQSLDSFVTVSHVVELSGASHLVQDVVPSVINVFVSVGLSDDVRGISLHRLIPIPVTFLGGPMLSVLLQL